MRIEVVPGTTGDVTRRPVDVVVTAVNPAPKSARVSVGALRAARTRVALTLLVARTEEQAGLWEAALAEG